MSVSRGREFLKKSVQLATMCESCRKEDRDRLWILACGYIEKAREHIPESQWSTLTAFECEILSSRVPLVPRITFFESEISNSSNNTIAPSFSQLEKQIKELEKQNDQLGKYKELSEKLKHDYIELEKFQTSYQKRVREEQSELQSEMKRMLFEIETIPELKRDVHDMECEMFRMRDRIKLLCAKHREEMTNMYTEMDTSNYERESLSTNLHQTQQLLLMLKEEKKSLQSEVQCYQNAFQMLLPHLNDQQRTFLIDLMQ